MKIVRSWTGLALALSLAASGCGAPETTEGSTEAAQTAPRSASSKIAIIGAGPSGLAAALQLRANGYRNVTVFEKSADAGGKVKSVMTPNGITEVGAVFASPDYTSILALAAKHNIPYVASPLPQYVITPSGQKQTFQSYLTSQYPGPLGALEIAGAAVAYSTVIDLFNSAYPKDKGFISQNAVAAVALGNIWENFDDYAAHHGFTPIAKLVKASMIGFGYGFYENAPAAYYLKLIDWLIKVDLTNTTSPINSNTYYVWPTGYQSLWTAVAADLGSVQYNATVTSLTRKSGKVQIAINGGAAQTFDDVIVSASFDKVPGFLKDPTPWESALISEVVSEHYAVTQFSATGLNRFETDFLLGNLTSAQLDHPSVWANATPILSAKTEAPYYVAWQIVDPSLSIGAINSALGADVAAIGHGAVKSYDLTQEWDNYFPHVPAMTLASPHPGSLVFYGLVDSQMQNGLVSLLPAVRSNTYYVGATLSFETVEHSADTSASIVNQHFPCLSSSCPAFTK